MDNVICVEGYKAFRGGMRIDRKDGYSCVLFGDWLYRPDTKCWYSGGLSYPEDICKIDLVE